MLALKTLACTFLIGGSIATERSVQRRPWKESFELALIGVGHTSVERSPNALHKPVTGLLSDRSRGAFFGAHVESLQHDLLGTLQGSGRPHEAS